VHNSPAYGGIWALPSDYGRLIAADRNSSALLQEALVVNGIAFEPSYYRSFDGHG
jgi:hypothetical protein